MSTAANTEASKGATTYLPLDYLLSHINESNPKDHDVGLIISSIERFGFRGAIQFDPRSETVVAGHGRLKALTAMRQECPGDPPEKIAKKGDDWLVPVKYESFEDTTERNAYTLADNSATIRGGWDQSHLATFLQTLAESDSDDPWKGTGFDGDDLDLLLSGRDNQTPITVDPVTLPQPRMSGGGFGVTVNVASRGDEDRLVELIEAHGFWAKRHSG